MRLPTNQPRRGFFRTLRDVVADGDWHAVALLLALYLICFGLAIMSPDATADVYDRSMSWAPPHAWSFLTIATGAVMILGLGFQSAFTVFLAAVTAVGLFSSISAGFWFAPDFPTGVISYAISAITAGVVAWRFAESQTSK